jgi:NAD(P)-dependent dehydrogenase (short-subunit alcohol dehydrogenase family)
MTRSRTAIVTGAGRGIGFTFAEALLAQGYSVVIADLEGAEEAAVRLEKLGMPCHGVKADVSSESDVRAMALATIDRFGGVDVLVNNAGLFTTLRPFEEISSGEWMEIMRVNTLGPFLCAKSVVPIMRQRGGGRIVNIASTVALKGVPGWLHYVASKGALIGMTRALAREVGKSGITVNAIAPGFTLSDGILKSKLHEVIGEDARRAGRSIPRDQVPQDLIGTLLYLVGEGAGFVTGQTIVVDGGSIFV